ncbi:MAG: Rv0623 family protein transcription factor [Pseudomonadota bacterium]|jgi:antitoxin VapB|uniref:Type II toxin-antitoxin system VapB family antitoxin n=1 Tax=Thiothrix fructosivorans TaxID=111770 RepID=A0A8B0SIG7_9GAMM|nr:type II toxin-antitoxin system VapB family antitoxin [Thiothrix fructosivorans]MBO0611611.1 type II toxin-antitoxin system VapB family antitoxin [Thiothrix fructosivorans]QTX10725.1 type II toxin-antitoxin system VapB family antitoxin [Thiothrix fructosivorans]
MALSIRNERAEQLAREIAQLTGYNMTSAIIMALEEKLERLRRFRRVNSKLDEIMAISRRCSALPNLDTRSPDEILGYDEHGVNTLW